MFLVWLIVEVFIFVKMTSWVGWGDTFLFYFAPVFLGVLLISFWSRMGLVSIQTTLLQGQVPGKRLLHTAAIFLGGVCLVVPTMTTRLLAVALILPGFRHLLIWRFQAFVAQKIATGSTQAFSFMKGGVGGFKFYHFRSGDGVSENRESGMRNVTPHQDILDVSAVRISHEEKPDSSYPRERSDS